MHWWGKSTIARYIKPKTKDFEGRNDEKKQQMQPIRRCKQLSLSETPEGSRLSEREARVKAA